MNQETPLLQVKDLSLSIAGQSILDGINFEVYEGETLSVVGESGSGKSMTALTILRLLPHTASVTGGNIYFQGESLFEKTEKAMQKVRGNQIGIIFQEPNMSLNPVLTIGRQIGEALILHQNLKGKVLKEKIIELLDEVSLPEPKHRINWYPHQLSGGQKQRVMIAMALACEPKLLIADEPTTALDVSVQARILEKIREIQQKRNLSVLLITHDMGIVYQLSDKILVMKKGQIVERNSNKAFFKKPQHPYSLELLKSLPNEGEFRTSIKDPKPIYQIDHLSVIYPTKKRLFRKPIKATPAVSEVSLTINEQETVALVGESGSGKTTVGKAILRLLDGTAQVQGELKLNNQAIQNLKQAQLRLLRKEMQIIFQDPFSSLNPRLSILETISEGMISLNNYANQQQCVEKCQQLLTIVGLDKAMLNRYPHEFSGGQRQRIAIARALAVEPKLIVCDEPTSSLDVSLRSQILQLMLELQQTMKLSLLFITHDLSLVPIIAHRVVVMKNGQIIEQGDCKQILTKPEQAYTQLLINSVPLLHR